MALKNAQKKTTPKRLRVRPILLLAFLPLLLLALGVLYLTGDRGHGESGKNGEGFILNADQAYPEGALPEELRFDRLLLEKSSRRLTAFFRGKAVRVYLVALGDNPEGHKEFEGDGRTPEGRYIIDSKNPNSSYYKNIGISYPNQADREHAAGLGKSPGGDIKIHGLAPHFAGLGQAHRIMDWTFGCIAVTNPEMEEIYRHTPVGTPIDIVP